MKISIIVPLYNSEKYIKTCIESFYKQDIPISDYEVICVDDCSPDESSKIVKQLQNKYSNLILLEHLVNKRTGGARNTGLNYATGEYIWFVDADDFIMPNILANTYQTLIKNNLDVLHFGFNEFILENIKINKGIESTSIQDGASIFFSDDFVWWKDHITVWPKIYKRDFLINNKIMFTENLLYEDNDFSFRVYANAQRVMHLNENLYVYRHNESSITHVEYNSKNIVEWLKLIDVLSKLKKFFKKNNYDKRFQGELTQFIKNLIIKTINTYKNFNEEEKNKSIIYYKKVISVSYIKYIGFFRYILLNLNF